MRGRPTFILLWYFVGFGVCGVWQSGDISASDEKPSGEQVVNPNRLDGAWVQLHSAAEAKMAIPRQHQTWFFINGQLTIERTNHGWEVGRYQILRANGLQAIELQVTGSSPLPFIANSGKEPALFKGIFRVDGESLTLCLATRPGAARPEQIPVKSDSDAIVFEFQRGAPLKDTAETKTDLQRMQGTWRVTEWQEGGVSKKRDRELRWIFSGDELAWMSGESVSEKPVFKLNANSSPKQFFMSHPDGEDTELLITGIYDLNDDRLKICLNMGSHRDGFNRPKEFSSAESKALLLVSLERETKGSLPAKVRTGGEQFVAPQHHARQIQGTWRVVEMTEGRPKRKMEQVRPPQQIVVTADKITFANEEQQVVEQFSYSLDSNSDPGRITLRELETSQDGQIGTTRRSYLGIYSLSEDTLQLAYSDSVYKRPREFAPRRLSRTFALKRDKGTAQ